MPRPSRRTSLLLALLLVLLVAGAARSVPGDAVEASSVPAVLGATTTATFTVDPQGHRTVVLLDGRKVAEGADAELTVPLTGLSDGRHRLVAERERGLLRRKTRTTREFTVDRTPPSLVVQVPAGKVRIKDRVAVKGTVEKGSTVTAAGAVVAMDRNGFTATFPAPPAGAPIVATDAAGNTTTKTVTVRTLYPSHIRAVHVTGRAWAYSKLRNPVLALARQKRINAIELDIKDEDGVVNYPTSVGLARTVGARMDFYDARRTTARLHAMGIRVIGRIVAFNDPKLSTWAFAHGRRDWVIQRPDGSKYLYGYNKTGFTNFANKDVRDYNQDLAEEAIRLGFDDVVYDYVRRPDGPIATMRFPGLRGLPEDSIASFLAETQLRIRPLGGSLGAAAFAQAATRPKATAQNIRKMAQHLDVVIPMNYPSHWNKGEYGVPDPYVGAYEIVKRSLVDWRRQVLGTGCVVVPWLQDENFRGVYTVAKVREQIAGTRANGIPGWLMWSAVARYQGAAYSPDATSAL